MGVSPPQPLLSAVLIARDEEEFLAGCLESLTGIVDQVVLVDTGSIDATPQIARRFGVDLIHHSWRDDFAEARNVSLDHASGQWILYIDADERLVDPDRGHLETLLTHADEVAFRVLLRPRVNSTPYREFRLWRNDPRIRFDGVIHEKVVPAIQRVAAEDGRPIGRCDLMLQHLGYEGNQRHKHERNLPLLRRQLEIEPENLFAWNHLARVLEALGEPAQAEEALVRGLEEARSQEASRGGPDMLASLSYGDLIRLRNMRGVDSSELLAEGLSKFPSNCLLLLMETDRLMRVLDYQAALVTFDRILAFDWSADEEDPPAYDGAIVDELPWAGRATCLFRLGRYEEAAEAYEEAARAAPGNDSYGVKAKLARARAERTGRH